MRRCLKTLRGLRPYQRIRKCWTKEPPRFKLEPPIEPRNETPSESRIAVLTSFVMRATLGVPVPDSAVSDGLRSGSSGEFIYLFGEFRLDGENRLLTCGGKEVALPGRAFDTLLMLVRRPGLLVGKEELMGAIWGGSFVEESNLTVAISTLRRALNEDPHDRRYIQTVPRRGYRFVAEVTKAARTAARQSVAAVKPEMDARGEGESAFEDTAAEFVSGLDSGLGAEGVEGFPVLPQNWASLPESECSPQLIVADRPAPWLLRHGMMPAVWMVLLGVLMLGGWLLWKPNQPVRSLAVLPISVEGGSEAGTGLNETMLLGMTDNLVARLEGGREVRPTSSILRYAATPGWSAVSAGQEQEVDAVLTGQVQRAEGRTQLRLELIRVSDGLTLWQDSFRAADGDLAGLEQQAGDVAAHELSKGDREFGRKASTSPRATATSAEVKAPNDPARQLYLRGRYFWDRRTVSGLKKSTECFRRAIDADPNYAAAYAGLADSYALLASFSVEPGRSANADARSAALSAIQLDPTLAEPHASLGMIYFFTDWNLMAAEKEFERAIRLNPKYATAHHWYALDLAAMGKFPEAIYEIRLAQKLDPLSLIIGTNVGWIEYLAHDYGGAVQDLQRVLELELDPNFARARTRLGMVEMVTGNNAAAEADLKQALLLSGDEDPWVEGLLGDAEGRAGSLAAAEHTLAHVSARGNSQYVPPTSRALVLLGLGRRAEAVAALGQAIDDHSTSMVYARVDPLLDSLRGDAAFQRLMGRMRP